MADNYTHWYNATNALDICGYKPRNISCFIWGANGPDPMFCYQMYNPLRKYSLSDLAGTMHTQKTGLFLRNMFIRARTDAQKDYCLGFLCHYSLDSLIHPFVQFVTESYGSVFNISSGHQFFETAVDSMLSQRVSGVPYADYEEYCPELTESEINQISYLLKTSVQATYPEYDFRQSEYIQSIKDFKFVKKFFYSPKKLKFPVAALAEKLLGFREGYVKGHMQPCEMEIPDYPFWQNMGIGLYSVETLDDILLRADYLSAESIGYGLKFFDGTSTIEKMLENVGNNKSYNTGLTVL